MPTRLDYFCNTVSIRLHALAILTQLSNISDIFIEIRNNFEKNFKNVFLIFSSIFDPFHINRVSSCLNPFPMLFLVPCRRFYWLYIAQSNTFLTKFLQILVFQNFQFFGKLSISRIWLIFVFIRDYHIATHYLLWVFCSMNNRV